MPWWAGKEEIRNYLRKINEKEKVKNPKTYSNSLHIDSPHRSSSIRSSSLVCS